eukprot:snap_masked-scaffold934_size79169-processed-gene-0.12 protein:Tk02403 transcript:snap_masked-scaffold934_size79169-processed-gene-0.12-mRNA-1 annotation:"conserved hypothetical protein"
MPYERVPLSSVPTSPVSPTRSPGSSLSFGPAPSGLPSPATAKSCMSAAAKRYKYLRRLLHFRQMDFEFAFWQMVYLMSAPQQVYRNFQYRKQTKLQFARDDPAFLVLLAGWLVVSSAGFALVLNIGFWEFVKFLLYVILVDCVGVGLVVATGLWALTNRYLIKPAYRELDVEWGFAFDVHLNAFFPLLVILHFIQLFFYHILISRDLFVATLFGNTLWLVALGYYIYITFLGYNSLNILQRTQWFLYPMVPLALFYGLTLITQWNLTKSLMFFYHYRVL